MAVTLDMLAKFEDQFEKDPVRQMAERAVFRNGILASCQNDNLLTEMSFTFSINVDGEVVANQRQSGRCWLFAALNVLRLGVERELQLKPGVFELSQNYNFFYDKLEKANFFYEQIIKSADSPMTDRRVSYLFGMPQQDGGEWSTAAALIQKYGVVPRTAMGETSCSMSSGEMDNVLNRKLRQDALQLRQLVQEGASDDDVQSAKEGMLNDVYKICAVCLGVPPKQFDFEWRDLQGGYHADYGLTPQQFYTKYCEDVTDFVSIVNYPGDDTPFGRVITQDMSNEVDGAPEPKSLNLPIDDMKVLVAEQLAGGDSVWFGCDVMQSSDIMRGLLDTHLYDVPDLFGITDTMDKKLRLLTGESAPTHAMVFGGVDVENGKPTKWKVENSWGMGNAFQKVGYNGYFIMTDDWFDEYVFEVVVHKKYIPEKILALFDTPPVVIPFYGNM